MHLLVPFIRHALIIALPLLCLLVYRGQLRLLLLLRWLAAQVVHVTLQELGNGADEEHIAVFLAAACNVASGERMLL